MIISIWFVFENQENFRHVFSDLLLDDLRFPSDGCYGKEEFKDHLEVKSKLENKQSLFRRTLGRGFPTLEMGVGRSLDLSTGNGTAYKSSFMQSVLPQIPRCDMVLLHCSQGSMQIDRFPCKFDSYSIGINFGLPKVKESGEQAEEPKSGDLRQMKIKRPALELRISAFSYLTH